MSDTQDKCKGPAKEVAIGVESAAAGEGGGIARHGAIGGDAIDADAVRPDFLRQHFGKAVDRRLGRRVRRVAGPARFSFRPCA